MKSLKGKHAITGETAIQLERVLGVPAKFRLNPWSLITRSNWPNSQREELSTHIDWVNQFPIKEMAKRTWIEDSKTPIDRTTNLLDFFGNLLVKAWETEWGGQLAQFRKSEVCKANPFALAAWIRRGETEGSKIECSPFSRKSIYCR